MCARIEGKTHCALRSIGAPRKAEARDALRVGERRHDGGGGGGGSNGRHSPSYIERILTPERSQDERQDERARASRVVVDENRGRLQYGCLRIVIWKDVEKNHARFFFSNHDGATRIEGQSSSKEDRLHSGVGENASGQFQTRYTHTHTHTRREMI